MSSHARLSPSSPRWVNCPGSVELEKNYPDIPGAAAISGTGTHLLLELVLKHDVTPESYEGTIIGQNHEDEPMGWLINQDRIDRVRICLDYIERRTRELDDKYPNSNIKLISETKVDVGGIFGRSDWGGTCDVSIVVMNNKQCLFIEVIDYKDGQGYVAVENNSQLMSYLAGCMRPFITTGKKMMEPMLPDGVKHGGRCTIVQPKTGTPIRYEDLTTQHVIDRVTALGVAAKETDRPNAALITGKHCRWCKHKDSCTTGGENSLERIMHMTKNMGLKDETLLDTLHKVLGNINSLSAEELGQVADMRIGMTQIFEKVEAEIEARINKGELILGYAMVDGNKKQAWNKKTDEIEKMLKSRRLKKDDMYPSKFISPAQMLKLDCLTDDQKAKIVDKYITISVGEKKLKRVQATVEEKLTVFDDLPTDAKPVTKSFL